MRAHKHRRSSNTGGTVAKKLGELLSTDFRHPTAAMRD
jgi:hypothetical protein